MKKIDPSQLALFITALIMVIMVPVWIFFIAPLLSKYNNKNYQQGAISIGELKKYTLNEKQKEIKTSQNIERKILKKTEEKFSNITTLNTIDSISDFLSREVILEKEESFWIDKEKKEYMDSKKPKRFFTFPENIQKKDYENINYPIFPNIKTSGLGFSHDENIFGLSVLVFRYNIEQEDEPEKKKGRYWGKLYTEPKTGLVVRQELNWERYIENNLGEKITLESGRLWQQDEEVKKNIRTAQTQKALSQLYEMWIPIYLLVSALALGIGFLLKGS